MSTILAVLGVLGPLAAAGYGIWRKYLSPEAQLAKIKAEQAASKAAIGVEFERLGATYKRIDKEATNEKAVLDRLNRPVK